MRSLPHLPREQSLLTESIELDNRHEHRWCSTRHAHESHFYLNLRLCDAVTVLVPEGRRRPSCWVIAAMSYVRIYTELQQARANRICPYTYWLQQHTTQLQYWTGAVPEVQKHPSACWVIIATSSYWLQEATAVAILNLCSTISTTAPDVHAKW